MAFVEDYTPLLADFGVAAVVKAVSLRGIFDTDYGDPMGLIAGARPVLTVSSAAVSSAAVGDAVTVGAVSYIVAEIQPDGTGMTRLVLEAV